MKGWRDVERGGVLKATDSSTAYKTGEWRNQRPVIDYSKCDKCGACWIFCPDAAISFSKEGYEIDLDYCKGCGICARECWKHAIAMVAEEE